MVRVGEDFGRGRVAGTVLCTVVQTNVARDAARAATTRQQYMTSATPAGG